MPHFRPQRVSPGLPGASFSRPERLPGRPPESPIFARDEEVPRPAWHIEIKYEWQAALLGPGEFLA